MSQLRTILGPSCVALFLVAGCATEGKGTGTLTQPVTSTAGAVPRGAGPQSNAVAKRYEGQVRFSWSATEANGRFGTLDATLPDGRTFAGEYAETTKENEKNIPAFFAFDCKWPSCFADDSKERGAPREFTGRLVARLVSGNARMVCSFELSKAAEGPKGGGLGSCVMSDGKHIESAALVEH